MKSSVVKGMTALFVAAAVVSVAAQGGNKPAPAANAKAAPMTWTGAISDDMCGADKHSMGKDDVDCVVSCVKGGSKYIFVNAKDKKVFNIANQAFADLTVQAGKTVELTGELKGDTITVSKIVLPPVKK